MPRWVERVLLAPLVVFVTLLACALPWLTAFVTVGLLGLQDNTWANAAAALVAGWVCVGGVLALSKAWE
jgi:hypothetical protein